MFFSPLGFSLLLVLSLSGLSLFGFSFLFSFFSSAFLGSIYRGQGRCFLQLSRGAAGCRPLGAAAEVRWVVRGRWSAIVFGRWAPGEREGPAKISKKSNIFPFFPAACSGGKKKDEQCRSKRHRSALFPFFFFLNG